MAGPLDSEEDIFEKLKDGVDPERLEERQKLVNERIHAQYERSQRILAELIDSNTTLPITISSINVLGAVRTRKDFLARILDPLLSANRDAPYTLAEALAEVQAGANKLHKFDIFRSPISVYLDRPDPVVAFSTPNDISVYLSVREKNRLLLRTGTDVGNVEGSAYGHLLWRNVFGGAEMLNVNASLGTRTRSAYQVGFSTPIGSDPDVRWEIGGLASSTRKISHEEVVKGWQTKLRWIAKGGNLHELAYSGLWRQVTGLAENASPTLRGDAGDSVKSSIAHTWTSDGRDNPILPTSGYFLKTMNELAGWGPLRGDVAFWKSEMESQLALPVPLPGVRKNAVTFTAGLRGGLLYPLALGGPQAQAGPQPSRINDRFQLGGPTDVRGFRLYGLGPRDGNDALGGDMYYACSANMFFPLPRVDPERPIRFQAFINGGRLVSLANAGDDVSKDGAPLSGSGFGLGGFVCETLTTRLLDGLPSTTAGIGLVYAHPVARFELNFSLPLVLRAGEQGRKGLSFGVGINFL